MGENKIHRHIHKQTERFEDRARVTGRGREWRVERTVVKTQRRHDVVEIWRKYFKMRTIQHEKPM